MISDGSLSAKSLAEIRGDNEKAGDWNVINTLVFLFTSFTTVGYGNHPSFVSTPPPCEYPGPQTATDNPSSYLLPVSMRQPSSGAWPSGNMQYGNDELPTTCFSSSGVPPPRCWFIADAEKTFDFSTDRMYWLHSAEEAGPANETWLQPHSPAHAIQVPGVHEKLSCTVQEMTNGTTVSSRFINGGRPWVASAPGGACWARYVDKCETDHLNMWRKEERKKMVAKLFTIVFVLVGIGILGEMAP